MLIWHLATWQTNHPRISARTHKALAFKPAKGLKAKIHGIHGISEIPSSVINIYDFTVCKQVKLKRAVVSVCSFDTKIF